MNFKIDGAVLVRIFEVNSLICLPNIAPAHLCSFLMNVHVLRGQFLFSLNNQ